ESGMTRSVVDTYLSSIPTLYNTTLEHRTDREGNGRLRFTDIEFRSDDGVPTAVVQAGKPLLISVAYTSTSDTVKNVEMSIDIFAQNGQCMLMLNNAMTGAAFASVPGGSRSSVRFARCPLSPRAAPHTHSCW